MDTDDEAAAAVVAVAVDGLTVVVADVVCTGFSYAARIVFAITR